ncbi:AraC family transcriptional regulator [Natronospira proteinivora]|uniref:AraC family transcriptional regulator n=1 Tax=Natronospira proteinivora TaxID=1807133 RepID=A0ABT1G8D5_9GAMM|nr:AraC family transcriptional regulator [Natronospira proteinivora]MCP1727579.1 AraC family transcriptional regulator [Natronospira proteinivora]
MGGAVEGICALAPGRASIEVLEAQRQATPLALNMVESAGPPGHVPAPPLPQLVISVALHHSFHYRCDLGAGPFSGQGIPLDFVLVRPNSPTWCQIDEWHRLRFLGMPLSLARTLLGRNHDDPLDFGRLHRQQNRDAFIAQALEAIWQELGQGDDTSRLFLETTIASLLARLERLAARQTTPVPNHGGLTAWQSKQVMDYMRAHLDRPLSLRELAGVVNLSPWHFARTFRESHGLPPHRCLTHLRLEMARELLSQSQQSVTEIANAVGYSSQHLARHFRRHLRCSPSEYRRQHRH